MCEKCEEAARVLGDVLYHQYGAEKLKEWSISGGRGSTEMTRMVAAYLILTDLNNVEDAGVVCAQCGRKVFFNNHKKLVCTDDKGNVLRRRCFEKEE